MYTIMKQLLIAALLSASTQAEFVQRPTRKEFGNYLKSSDRILVSFTSLTLKSLNDFNNVFKSVAESSPTLALSIDCDQESELCSEYDVNSYPTIRVFEKSEDGMSSMTRYRGPRTKRAMQSHLLKKELPAVSQFQQSNFSNFKAVDDIVIMAYLSPSQDKLTKAFKSVATEYHNDFVFGYTVDSALAEAEAVPVPSIVCYKNTDGDNKVLNGYFTEADLELFLESATKVLIRDFSEKYEESFMMRDKLTVYVFTSTDDSAISMRHRLTPLAKKYEKYVIFAMVDSVKHHELAENLGVKLEDKNEAPALAVHAPMNNNVFRYRQSRQIEASGVESMLTTILEGRATNGQVFGEDPAASQQAEESRMHSEL